MTTRRRSPAAVPQLGLEPEPAERRVRPAKPFRVLKPYGPYVRGQIIHPTGLYRDQLLARGVIVAAEDAKCPAPPSEQ